MSAFIVEPLTINETISYLNVHADHFRHVFRDSGYDLSQYDDLVRLAGDLHDLNCAAVQCRYGQPMPSRDDQGRSLHRFTITAPPTAVQAYKSTYCLRYQCAEGDVKERPLFKLLTELHHAMAHRLVCETPEYQRASWSHRETRTNEMPISA